MENRQQRVTINGSSSSWLPVTSGVPQGSILGPILFLIYINDLPNVIRYSNISLFADDTKFFMNINGIQDCNKVQRDLESVYEWSKTWLMKFNTSKCKVLSITRKTIPTIFPYNINGEELERVDSINDLGITINKDLKWNCHAKNIVKKANSTLWLIKRSIGYHAPSNVKRQLYVSLVRSLLEYCTQVWGGLSVGNSEKIERVQRSATKYILDFEELSYTKRLCKLNLLPLSYRRDKADILFFHKCVYEKCIDIDNYVKFTCNNARVSRSSLDSTRLRVPCCKTQTRKLLYFARIVNLWNNIPVNIRNLTDFNNFKSALCVHFKSLFINSSL